MTFDLTEKERHALEVVFDAAEWHSGTGLRMRRLLCSWWNADELGGFHLSDLWQFDDVRLPAALTVIALIARAPGGTYASSIEGFDARMRALATRRARELEIGAQFTFEHWNEARQDWEQPAGLLNGCRYKTRHEAESELSDCARRNGWKRDDLRVVPVWDDEP
jgi:hypothetical protein